MSKYKENKLDTSTFPCLKYLLAQAKAPEDLYLFSRILFEACDKLSVEPLRALLLFKSYKMLYVPHGLVFGEYKGKKCTSEEYRSSILQDRSLLNQCGCRDQLLISCPSAIMPKGKKMNTPDVCCLCPVSKIYKNKNYSRELMLFKYMLSSRENFEKVSSWAVIPRSSILMFRGCFDLASNLDTKAPVVVPLLSLCAQKLIKNGAGILDIFIDLNEKKPSVELIFNSIIISVREEINAKYPYISDIFDGISGGLFDKTVKNAIMQLSREVASSEALSDKDADGIMNAISKNKTKKAKGRSKPEPFNDAMLDGIFFREAASKGDNSDDKTDDSTDDKVVGKPESVSEESEVQASGEGEGVSEEDVSDHASVPVVTNENRVPLQEEQVEFGVNLPSESGLYMPDIACLSPVYDLTDETADDVVCSIEVSKICVLEVLVYDGKEPSYLIFTKKGEFWTTPVSKTPDQIRKILSANAVLKLCWQPYLLYSVSRNYGLSVRNVYSLYSAASMMGYDVSDRAEELKRCALVYESQKQKKADMSLEKEGFDMYIRAWAVQKNDALMSEEVERVTELWDEVLGSSYDLGFSLESTGNPMSINSDGAIVYKSSPGGSVIPANTLLLVISIKGIPNGDCLTLLMKSLLYLAGKKYFFKLPLSLFGMDDKSGMIEVLCDEAHSDLIEDEIQGFLHRFMSRHNMRASVMVHREYSLKTYYKPVQFKTMGLKDALVNLITADRQIQAESSRVSSYAKKPTGEENKSGVFM